MIGLQASRYRPGTVAGRHDTAVRTPPPPYSDRRAGRATRPGRHRLTPLAAAAAAAAILLAAAAPAAAAEPENIHAGAKPSGETTVWQQTLTPVTTEVDGTVYTGCADGGKGLGVGVTDCSGQRGYDGQLGTAPYEGATGSLWLSNSAIVLSGVTYRITALLTDSSGVLTVTFDKQIPDELLDNMSLEIHPYVEPEDSLVTQYDGFIPGYTAPSANRLEVADDASTVNLPDGGQSLVFSSGPADWKMATSESVKHPNGGVIMGSGKGTWGNVTMRLTYEGTPPQATQKKSGQGSGATPEPRPDGKIARPDKSTADGKIAQPEKKEEAPGDEAPGDEAPGDGVTAQPQHNDNGSPESADPAPPQQDNGDGDPETAAPQQPALEGAAADYDADGDGQISSDEYAAGAADFGNTKLTLEEILQIRQAYIDSQK